MSNLDMLKKRSELRRAGKNAQTRRENGPFCPKLFRANRCKFFKNNGGDDIRTRDLCDDRASSCLGN